MGQGNRSATKIRPKAVGSGIFADFCSFPDIDKCRSEVAGDAMSGVTVHYVGMDVRSTFGVSR